MPNVWFNDRIVDSLLERITGENPSFGPNSEHSKMCQKMIKLLRSQDRVPISTLLDQAIPFMKEEDFVLKREYKIVKSVSTVFGKWPQTYGNAFFTDSKWLLSDFYEMMQSNM